MSDASGSQCFVASLELECSRNHEHKDSLIRISANEELDFGRPTVQRICGVEDHVLSTHHLRFRCVSYDDDDGYRVAPMIYVRVLSSNAVWVHHSNSDGHRVNRRLCADDGDFLLNGGDVLRLTSMYALRFSLASKYQLWDDSLTATQEEEAMLFSDRYTVSGRKLGGGGQASVFVAVKNKTQQQLACKIVPMPKARNPTLLKSAKGNLRPTFDACEDMTTAAREALLVRRQNLAREYEILKSVSHPNIVALEKVICSKQNIFILQELVPGGDLLSYTERHGMVSEPETAVIMRQVLKAVEYLHSNGIVHRDIKPENLLLACWAASTRVVLTDFGQARFLDNREVLTSDSSICRMQSHIGTRGYTAPEVHLNAVGYSKAVDIWSVGCVTATLLTNRLIFDTEHADLLDCDPDALAEHFDLGFLDVGEEWAGIGRLVKSFVKACLAIDEDQRLTASQALQHPWFTNKHYAMELNAVYERAIRDWKPWKRSGEMIEVIHPSGHLSMREPPISSRSLLQKRAEKSPYFDGGREASPIAPEATSIESLQDKTPQIEASGADFSNKENVTPTVSKRPAATSQHQGNKRRLSILDYAPPETASPSQIYSTSPSRHTLNFSIDMPPSSINYATQPHISPSGNGGNIDRLTFRPRASSRGAVEAQLMTQGTSMKNSPWRLGDVGRGIGRGRGSIWGGPFR